MLRILKSDSLSIPDTLRLFLFSQRFVLLANVFLWCPLGPLEVGGPWKSGAPVHWTAWTPCSYATANASRISHDEEDTDFGLKTFWPILLMPHRIPSTPATMQLDAIIHQIPWLLRSFKSCYWVQSCVGCAKNRAGSILALKHHLPCLRCLRCVHCVYLFFLLALFYCVACVTFLRKSLRCVLRCVRCVG